MQNSTDFGGVSVLWWLLLALFVIAVVAVRYRRSRAPKVAPPPEPSGVPVDASLLDSSHIGGPIAGTEQFERFNPDTSARSGRSRSGSR
jgi:hypothetical protein